jgi:hypothetical protein
MAGITHLSLDRASVILSAAVLGAAKDLYFG